MDDTAQFVSNLNVARFVDKLQGEHDPATRALSHGLLLEEWNKSGFNLKQLDKMRCQMIEGNARIAIQKAVVETLTANSQLFSSLNIRSEIWLKFKKYLRNIIKLSSMPYTEAT